ncbi:MAG: hypothetical protein HOW73_47115 [Polyangiaceae bacterium]|nr:hypothetical protein [Polyangiaceae bacterium]
MRTLTLWCALALGAVGIGACTPYPDPDTPVGCIPVPDDGKLLAQNDTSPMGTESKIRATEPYTEQKSQSPGGAATDVDRRYYRDKDQQHLEKKQRPAEFDSTPYCPREPTSEEAPVSS